MDARTAPVGTELWFRRYHRAGEGDIRLICFPHAGGAANYYFPLSRAMTPRFEVWSVQYPGRQDRRHEPLVETIPALADQVTERLLTAFAPFTNPPVAFFGHSMGAVVAFEVARRLQRLGRGEPRHLFVSGRRAPDRHRVEDVHLRDDAGLLSELRGMGGTDPRVLADADLLRLVLPVFRGDYRAIETYRYAPGPPLSCPITAIFGDRDPRTTTDEALAWSRHTSASFAAHVFPGGHFYLSENAAGIFEVIESAFG